MLPETVTNETLGHFELLGRFIGKAIADDRVVTILMVTPVQ